MLYATETFKIFGSASAVADVIGRHRSSVSRWRKSRAEGGSDNVVPQKAELELREWAALMDIDLSRAEIKFDKP